MKSHSSLRYFLSIAGSSLLAISHSHAQTTLADSYLTSLDVSSPTTLFSSLNFPSILDGPLTGSSTLTHTGYFGSQLSLVYNGAGNTFNGNIIIDSGTLRIAGSPFASNGGFTAPSMTSSDTITINRAGTLLIDDTVTGGYTANRFGSVGQRPAVNLAGGRINLTGLNNASSSVQSLGALTDSSGYSIINVTRNAGTPTLNFDSLAINSGSVINFYSATLGTGTNDARITFATAPTLTNGILAGAKYWSPGAAGQGEFATYGANGVTAFTAYDVVSNDINTGTSSTTNFAMTAATTPVTLSADRAVNSLNYRANGGTWSLGGFKLTLTSGMFLRNGTNSALTIDTGTMTAGNGADDIDLHILTAQQNVTINALIADNADSAVTLVKSHGNQLTVSGGANNTYTGGTFVVDGTLATGSTAGRNYLGTGKVTVDGTSTLTLGSYGATSNVGTGANADFTAINGGQIKLAAVNHGGNGDTFNIGAGSVIYGSSAANSSLASLTRGTNVTLAEDAIIGHDYILGAALNLTTGTIKNLGTNADLYYGFNGGNNQAVAGAVINIGTGTAFKGLALFGNNGTFDTGTINVGSGTTDVYIKTNGANTSAPFTLTLGYDFFTGAGPTIALADAGTLDVNVLGNMNSRDSNGVFGDTSTGRNVVFVATAGSNLQFGSTVATPGQGMGSGTGIASARIENGGSITTFSQAAALNGAVTVQAGGRFDAALAGGVTGSGQLTFNEGSIINITNATGFSGTQASAASIAAGTIVRLGVGSFGTTATTLDSVLGSGSKNQSYLFVGNQALDPSVTPGAVYTLNKTIGGVGGVLTNDATARTINALTNGKITLGANGGIIAATTGTIFTVAENIDGGALTIGSTAIIDGAPKRGTVLLSSTLNSYTGTTTINAGTLDVSGGAAIPNAGLVSIANVAGATFKVSASETIGNLNGGALSTVSLGTTTLTLGDSSTQTFAGTFSGATAGNLVKQGAGVFEMSGTNALTGTTAISGGMLKISGSSALSTGNLSLSGSGILGLANGNFSRTVGTGAGAAQFTGSGGFAAFGGTRTVQFSGSSINWNATNFIGTDRTLILGSSVADGTVDWQQAISMAGATRTVQVNNGSATVDAIMSGTIAGGTSGTANGFTKTGTGTLALTSNSNSYWGATTVSNGTLTVGNGGADGILSSNSATISVASGATLAVNRSNAVSQAASGGLGNGSAVISGDGGFTQAGSGTTTLTLANTYTGATNVNAGTLLINGSTSSTSLVTVNTGGTLGGTGTIGGSVTLNDGAFLSPGASIESLATGSNTWNGGSTFIFEFSTDGSTGTAGTQWDLLAITGTLDLAGASSTNRINFDLLTMADASNSGLLGTWNPNASALWSGFVTTTGGITGFAANLFDFDTTGFQNSLNGSFSIARNGNNLDLVYTAVPEPRVALLGGIGMLMLLLRRRSRTFSGS